MCPETVILPRGRRFDVCLLQWIAGEKQDGFTGARGEQGEASFRG